MQGREEARHGRPFLCKALMATRWRGEEETKRGGRGGRGGGGGGPSFLLLLILLILVTLHCFLLRPFPPLSESSPDYHLISLIFNSLQSGLGLLKTTVSPWSQRSKVALMKKPRCVFVHQCSVWISHTFKCNFLPHTLINLIADKILYDIILDLSTT